MIGSEHSALISVFLNMWVSALSLHLLKKMESYFKKYLYSHRHHKQKYVVFEAMRESLPRLGYFGYNLNKTKEKFIERILRYWIH